MTLTGGTVTQATQNGKDGATITQAEYNDKSWWQNTAGFDFTTTWKWHDEYKLPYLFTPVQLTVTDPPQTQQGDGSVDNPFIIKTEEELRKVGTGVDGWDLDKHYVLQADIDVSGEEWEAIGDNYYDDDGMPAITPFTGSFDGKNHTITGLYINKPDEYYQGMFKFIAFGEIKNVALENVNISGWTGVGGITGKVSNGDIINCSVNGNIYSGDSCVGGITGIVDNGNIINCSVNGNIYGGGDYVGGDYVGGIAGATEGNIINCYSTGNVSGTGNFVGGIAGSISGSISGSNNVTIENCYSTSNVSGVRNVGGIVGANENRITITIGTIENCYSTGNVSGTENVGGIAGYNAKTISSCVSLNGSVTGSSYIGRITGDNSGGLSNNYSNMSLYAGSSSVPPDPDSNDIDGGDIIPETQWGDLTWWQSLGFTDPWWDGKLPPVMINMSMFSFNLPLPDGDVLTENGDEDGDKNETDELDDDDENGILDFLPEPDDLMLAGGVTAYIVLTKKRKRKKAYYGNPTADEWREKLGM